MKVSQIMTASPIQTCRPEMTLDHAARLLWDHDCGILPVIDDDDHVIGTITDRDICMAAFTTDRPLSELMVDRSMSSEAYTCNESDDVENAVEILQNHRVRRLPVVDADEHLVGILSMNDLAREARAGAVSPTVLAETLAAICSPRGRLSHA